MMTRIDKIKISLANENPEALFLDGMDDALLGIDEQASIAVYDSGKCLRILQSHGMTYHEAREYYEFNTLGAYVGEYTPIHVRTFDDNDNEND